jgi:type VI protein secretion system component VasF
MPKRAPSAYNLYVKDAMSEIRRAEPGLTLGEYMKKCSEQWKSLSGGEKQVYAARAAQAKEELKRRNEEDASSDDLKGAFARLERAITTMRSSPKKTELRECVADVRRRIQRIHDDGAAAAALAMASRK